MSDEKKRKSYDNYGFGASGYGSSSFNFKNANDIFKHFFTDSGFDDADDADFFGNFFSKSSRKGQSLGGFGGFSSFDDDDFFSKGFGNGIKGGFSSSSFSSTSFGGSGGVSKSTSSVTKTM